MREPIVQLLADTIATDSAFRARFDRDPRSAADDAGFPPLSDEEVQAARARAAGAPPRRRFAISRQAMIVVLAVVLLTAAGAWWGMRGLAADLARRTGVATPEVQYTDVRWHEEDAGGRMQEHRGYDVRYAFTAEGARMTGARTRDQAFRPGEAYVVCYNPDDPADHGFYRASAVTCGGS